MLARSLDKYQIGPCIDDGMQGWESSRYWDSAVDKMSDRCKETEALNTRCHHNGIHTKTDSDATFGMDNDLRESPLRCFDWAVCMQQQQQQR